MLGDKLARRLSCTVYRASAPEMCSRCLRLISNRIAGPPAKFSALSHIGHGNLPCPGFHFMPDLGKSRVDLTHVTTILDHANPTSEPSF